LTNEKATHREGAVYRLLHVFGVPTLRARPARIRYVFTPAGTRGASTAQPPLLRDALLLEDDPAVLRRVGAVREIPGERFTTARDALKPADTLRLAFAQAMIGNFDWCLRMAPGDRYRCNAQHPLWNIMVLEREDGTRLPLMYDFDLAGMVVGRHTWFGDVFHEGFAGSRVEIEVVSQVQRTRSLFGRAELDNARQEFLSRKRAAYHTLEQTRVDDEGARIMRSYLDAFFAAIGTDAAFYRPVVVDAAARIFADAAATQPACGDGVIPVGTPVVERGGGAGLVRVTVLDALWHWPSRCDAIRKSDVWISRAAIGTGYPAR
jgi:hypothetical protein